MKFWKLGHVTDNWPLIGARSSEKTTSGHILPINQEVQSGSNAVLPMQVLRPIIERAKGVAILNECMCRRGQKCVTYPRNFGCLLLGDVIEDIEPSLARIVTRDEAISHAKHAIRMGLVPLVIHDAVDAWIWGLDFNRMMNVCFCCECCCDVRIGIRNRVRGFYENIHRLPGFPA
jgi:UDP-glucose 4-epimerase